MIHQCAKSLLFNNNLQNFRNVQYAILMWMIFDPIYLSFNKWINNLINNAVYSRHVQIQQLTNERNQKKNLIGWHDIQACVANDSYCGKKLIQKYIADQWLYLNPTLGKKLDFEVFFCDIQWWLVLILVFMYHRTAFYVIIRLKCDNQICSGHHILIKSLKILT